MGQVAVPVDMSSTLLSRSAAFFGAPDEASSRFASMMSAGTSESVPVSLKLGDLGGNQDNVYRALMI